MRAVLDPNVIISALLSRSGTPARLLRAWVGGDYELIVSPKLLAELERALAYPKLRRRIPAEDASSVHRWLAGAATVAADPDGQPPIHSPDPGDDYLLALAAVERAALVSGDRDVLSVAGELPIFSPAAFLTFLAERGR